MHFCFKKKMGWHNICLIYKVISIKYESVRFMKAKNKSI
jgi:hypothetical protein